MNFSPYWLRLLSVRSKARWSWCSWLIVYCCSHWMWGLCVWCLFCYSVLCVRLVLQSSWSLLCFNCLPGVLWQSVSCGSSSRCQGLACCVWLWYFLIILTCFCWLMTIYNVYGYDFVYSATDEQFGACDQMHMILCLLLIIIEPWLVISNNVAFWQV